ncbi:MAG: NmrA family NAD(P)-binding protein [Thiolinea sp.]
MKTIAVLGANGRLANEVMQVFARNNFRVIAVTRNGDVRHAPSGIESRAADAMDEAGLIAATEGADFIFNGLNPAYTEWQDKVLPMAKNVIAAVAHHGAIHLFPGNVYNYGEAIPVVCDEQTPFQANDHKGLIRIEMEALFAAAAEQGVATTMIRAGDFYGGSGTGSWFDLVLTSKLVKGKFTYPGDPAIEHSWAYIPDLAKAFLAVAQRSDRSGGFERFGFAGHTLSGIELQQLLEQSCGKTLQRGSMPWPMIKLLGWFVPMLREIAGVSYLWFRPHRIDGQQLQRELGELEFTPPAVAVKETLVQLKLNVV